MKVDMMMWWVDFFISCFFFGLIKFKVVIIGIGFFGIVVVVGKDVWYLEFGDVIFGEIGVFFGVNVEYVIVGEDDVISIKFENLSFEVVVIVLDGLFIFLNFFINVY